MRYSRPGQATSSLASVLVRRDGVWCVAWREKYGFDLSCRNTEVTACITTGPFLRLMRSKRSFVSFWPSCTDWLDWCSEFILVLMLTNWENHQVTWGENIHEATGSEWQEDCPHLATDCDWRRENGWDVRMLNIYFVMIESWSSPLTAAHTNHWSWQEVENE